ncbi:MAG TPA: hypothetical protein VII78_18745 [Myxococcota bacterium]|jgi:hypothetical protein
MPRSHASHATRRRAARLWLAALLCAGACSEPETPESRVRAALGELERAAEAGEVSEFRDLISERYRDESGHDKRALADFLRFHVLAHPDGREVILRVRDVRLTSDATASVVAHAGLAGAGQGALHADAYALDVDLALEDGAWRVTWAQWRPAAPAELL